MLKTARRRRRSSPCGTLAALAVAVLFVNPLPWPAEAADSESRPSGGVVIETSSWEPAAPGARPVFTAEVRNQGSDEFRGDLVLVPLPAASVTTGAGGAGQPRNLDMLPAAHRTPFEVRPGASRTLSVVLTAGPNRYQAEVHDPSGRLVAKDEPRAATKASGRDQVGLLSDQGGGRGLLATRSRAAFDVSPLFSSAQDFPENAVVLSGLGAVVVDDFDSAGLGARQVQALRDFVGLGGSLVLGGGAAAARTVLPLPEDLTPLRPTGTATAPLGALADLAGLPSTAPVTVATGPIVGGRAVLTGGDGVPLIIERAYGSGRIVQVAYGLLQAGQDLRDEPGMATLAADHPLQRAGIGGRPSPDAPREAGAGEDQAWAALDAARTPPPALGRPAAAILAYSLLVGPLLLVVLRRRGKSGLIWVGVSVVALALGGATYGMSHGPWRRTAADHAVQVVRQGADGTVQVEGYHRLLPPARGHADVQLGPGTLAWVVPRPVRPRQLPDLTDRLDPGAPDGAGVGRAEVRVGDPTRVALDDWPVWSTRLLRTSSVASRPDVLEAHLRLVGDRLVGTVSNRSAAPIRHLRAQAGDGSRAEVADVLGPGASIEVGATLVSPPPAAKGATGTNAGALESLLQPDAGQSQPGSGELSLIGLTAGTPDLLVDGRRPRGTTTAAVVARVRLEAADSPGAGLGRGRLVCSCGTVTGPFIYDIGLPPGVGGPLAVTFVAEPQGSAEDGAEVYSWRTATWRPIPEPRKTRAQLEAAEVDDGMVRVRTRGTSITGVGVVGPR